MMETPLAKKKNKKSPPRTTDIARKIWLAGIGAYGKAFTEAQGSLAKMSEESTRLFDDLVAKGEEIEETVEERGREIAERVKAQDFSIDDRIKKMRARLNLSQERREDRLDAIEKRLSAIEQALAALADGAKPAAKKTARKKAPAKKKAVTKKTAS